VTGLRPAHRRPLRRVGPAAAVIWRRGGRRAADWLARADEHFEVRGEKLEVRSSSRLLFFIGLTHVAYWVVPTGLKTRWKHRFLPGGSPSGAAKNIKSGPFTANA
jgi:hypothetical protein